MKLSITTISLLATISIAACVQDQSTAPKQSPEKSSEQYSQIKKDSSKHSKLNLPQIVEMDGVLALEEKEVFVRQELSYPKAVRKMKSMSAPLSSFVAQDIVMQPYPIEVNREQYAHISSNSVKQVSQEPVSTFSIDVDTGAYAVVRRHLNQGVMPPSDAVRIEELVNYFDYQYTHPKIDDAPFTVSTEIAPTPWNANTQLVQIGLQGYLPDAESRSPANLVFLIDVSGSMNSRDKLPLLKSAFRLLVNKLTKQDSISIVVYAGSSGVVLEPTKGDQKGSILAALDKLSAGGSTHGSAGIKLAYSMAQQSFIKDGINRVILATDGDFNVGTVNHQALLDLIERKKSKGIALTTLGFGSGNYNDKLMEQLADHGDGNYAYIDNLNEARKTLVNQISATLETIARDVKIQIEWNPAVVSEYRLIGYENRLLNREDFNNDKIDAGEIGAGHTVTALYEITLVADVQTRVDPLRYQSSEPVVKYSGDEIAFLKLRYKKPGERKSRLLQHALNQSDLKEQLESASTSLRFAASVAAFGELLRGGKNLVEFGYPEVLKLARSARGKDEHGYRGEFVRLVELSESLDTNS